METIKGTKTIGKKGIDENTVLIFDEVDGMSSGDRGGSSQLLQFVKGTSFPMICICNDVRSPKMKTLETHCVSLRFSKP